MPLGWAGLGSWAILTSPSITNQEKVTMMPMFFFSNAVWWYDLHENVHRDSTTGWPSGCCMFSKIPRPRTSELGVKKPHYATQWPNDPVRMDKSTAPTIDIKHAEGTNQNVRHCLSSFREEQWRARVNSARPEINNKREKAGVTQDATSPEWMR